MRTGFAEARDYRRDFLAIGAQPPRLETQHRLNVCYADQAWRHIGQPCFDLTTRPLLTQHNGAAIIQPRRHGMSSYRYQCRSRQLRY